MSATNDELDWHGTRCAYCACLHFHKRVTKCRSINRAIACDYIHKFVNEFTRLGARFASLQDSCLHR